MKKLAAALVALILGTPVFAAETTPSKAGRIDINTATEEQLKAMPGVGDEDARRIIAARPYHSKEELKTKEVISAEAFEKIKKLIESVC